MTKKERKQTKSRYYVFTINNYTQKDLKKFHLVAESLEKHRYICYGLEVAPKTGTKHIQGYIELNNAQRFNHLHKYFNFTKDKKMLKFHIEIANGTAEQNKTYCKKEGDFFEFGEPVKRGDRPDMKKLKGLIKENPHNMKKVIDEHATNMQQIRFVERLASLYLPHRNPDNPPVVYWIFGNTGIGKTKLVFDTFEDVCSVSTYRWPGTDYEQNECFLLDDFRTHSLDFEQIIKIADRYPYTLEYKGGTVPLDSPYIIFTSPNEIEKTFGYSKENLIQLKRRIIEIDLDAIVEIGKIEDINLRDLQPKYEYRTNLDGIDF